MLSSGKSLGSSFRAQALARSTSSVDADGEEEPWLTAQHHDKDPEHFFIVGVWGNIAKADWDESGEGEVESCAVATLQKSWGM